MLTFVIGGSGSGKSAFAEALVRKLPGPRIYLATMAAEDEESRERIRRHRAQRAGGDFLTVERTCRLREAEIPFGANVLLEDLSNLLANELYLPQGSGVPGAREGLESLMERCAHLVIVSNEVFSDGSGYAGESLRYLRELAALNRWLAAEAELAVEVVCGLPNVLKGELRERENGNDGA